MSAETLRRAASLMRERAEAVPEQAPVKADVMGVWLNSRYYLTTTPAVALAVADWLDGVAEIEDRNEREMGWSPLEISDALAVARAYLGESS